VIVLEGRTQTLVGRFMYGPLDVVSLSGEKVTVSLLSVNFLLLSVKVTVTV